MTEVPNAGTTHHPRRQSTRLQTSEQQPLAVLKLFLRQEPAHQYEGREPLKSQGSRRGLVFTTSRQTPRWRDQERKDVSRGVGALPTRVRHHHAGTTQPAIRRGPALAMSRTLGALLREPGSIGDHGWQDPGIPDS